MLRGTKWKACKFIPSYVFTRLSACEAQLLLEEVDADLVAAGEHNPGPGCQEVSVHFPHSIRVGHQAPGGPQGVGVNIVDISEIRKTVLVLTELSSLSSNLLS